MKSMNVLSQKDTIPNTDLSLSNTASFKVQRTSKTESVHRILNTRISEKIFTAKEKNHRPPLYFPAFLQLFAAAMNILIFSKLKAAALIEV